MRQEGRSGCFWHIVLATGAVLVGIPVSIFVLGWYWTGNVEQAALGASWFAFFLLPPGTFVLAACAWRGLVHWMDRFMDEHP